MAGIVNISPRVLPTAVGPDRMGLVINATDLLLEEERRKQAMSARAKELEGAQAHDIAMAELTGGQALEQIVARGTEERAGQRLGAELETGVILPARTRMEEQLIGRRGVEERTTDQFGFELRSPLEERRLGIQEDELGIRREGLGLQREELRSRERMHGEEMTARALENLRSARADQMRLGFPLEGLARDYLELSAEDENLTNEDRIRRSMEIAAGRSDFLGRPAGVGTNTTTRTPPPGGRGGFQLGERGDTVGWTSRDGQLSFGMGEVDRIRAQPMESHVETLLGIPDDETRQEYLELLDPTVAAQALQLARERGGR